MDIVSGACSVDKVAGMIHIREDLTPSMLEWKAIDQDKMIGFPLNTITNLQATKEDSPKMILKLFYKPNIEEVGDGEEVKNVRFTFNNRPTMNNIKDSLQTIVARSRTVIKDQGGESNASTPNMTPTPGPGQGQGPNSSGSSTTASISTGSSISSTSSQIELSDSALLKNLQLQQKLLLEDKQLRNIFTQSVMHFKLSPTIFWSTRLNQLRTFALTISQHKGPYNVLSTIKPVATSDNQVIVNVSREVINEIFDTYPIIRKAYQDLVPAKFQEGEFWSRFFNSKLFRRLRGDKINNITSRGDVVLDKYLYIDSKFIEREEQEKEKEKEQEEQDKEKLDKETDASPQKKKSVIRLPTPEAPEDTIHINKFLDLLGNEEDNSQKLGNKPDLTMRFEDNFDSDTHKRLTGNKENEMIILMKNMNKLSSKMMNMTNDSKKDDTPVDPIQNELNEYEEEFNLHDLQESEPVSYITIQIDTNKDMKEQALHDNHHELSQLSQQQLSEFLLADDNCINNEVDLSSTYKDKNDEIQKSNVEINNLIRQNFRTFKLISKDESQQSQENNLTNLIPNSVNQEIIKYNITIVEFLSHFWKLFLSPGNSKELKRIFTSLKNCQNNLQSLKERFIKQFNEMEIVQNNEKLRDKIIKDFQNSIDPMEISLNHACNEYMNAIRSATSAGNSNGFVNGNGRDLTGTPDEGGEVHINGNGKRLLQS
ncbi:hypothetical protein DFJ63DRAFT_312915 [Scheffersomyces coipomensis]|uniref:uncharacterized protein n=1 Tax=Scheffersomyces coipomensis TaxID=1788519 RepID=UPI00315C9DBC